MKLTEFEFIHRYILSNPIHHTDVVVKAGDDAAVVDIPEGHSLVVTFDNLVEGRHFFPNTPAHVLGYRILAVNLSDLAAMGAKPSFAILGLTLPELDSVWVEEFFSGFYALANQHHISLIGGNTTRGPCNIAMTLQGIVKKNKAVLRSTACVNDKIVVSGPLGDAGIALDYLRGKITDLTSLQEKYLLDAFYYPQIPVNLGMALCNNASAAIDISDGLVADLNHILVASQVGARLWGEALPFSAIAQAVCIDNKMRRRYQLYSGDVYQLCFTISDAKLHMLQKEFPNLSVIGEIVPASQGFTLDEEPLDIHGWDHFDNKT